MYHEPKIHPFHLNDSPNSWWDEFSNAVKIAEQKNNEAYLTARKAYSEILRLAEIVWGANSTEYKYLKQHSPKSTPNFTNLKKKMLRKFDEFLEANRNREYQANYRLRQMEAVERLEKAGYVLGGDFHRGNAISFEKRVGNKPDERLQDYRQYEG